MRIAISLLWVMAGLASAGPRLCDCEEEEKKRLQGSWRVVRAVNDGEDVAKEELVDLLLVFEGGSLQSREGDKVNDRVDYKLHPKTSPKGIDFHFLAGKKKGRIDRAIYHFDGKTLRLCIQENPKGPRPTEFTSPVGSNCSLITLRRVFAPDKEAPPRSAYFFRKGRS